MLTCPLITLSDGSGSIDREEFLQIPAIANNPLASRLIAIFDEEYVAAECSGKVAKLTFVAVVAEVLSISRSLSVA